MDKSRSGGRLARCMEEDGLSRFDAEDDEANTSQ